MEMTLVENGSERLGRLTPILGFSPDEQRKILGIFRAMSSGWGRIRCGGRPPWPSDICDDSSPFEFSLAFEDGTPELRILAEIQAERPTMIENWRAALHFTEKVAMVYGLSLERLNALLSLFAPTFVTPRFCLWHAFCFRPGAPPALKVYLNPLARGPAIARRLVIEALSRLGFASGERFLPLESAATKTIYFSLDLPPSTPDAQRPLSPGSGPRPCVTSTAPRVKVYTAHHGAEPAEIEAHLRVAAGRVPGQVESFCEAMRGPKKRIGRAEIRPVQTCLSFTEEGAPPTSGTVYFPVRSYADSDLDVRERVIPFLDPDHASLYLRVLEAFAERPLSRGAGMCSYVSLRQAPGQHRLTVYLAPELFSAARRADLADSESGVRSKEGVLFPFSERGSHEQLTPMSASSGAARAPRWRERSRGW